MGKNRTVEEEVRGIARKGSALYSVVRVIFRGFQRADLPNVYIYICMYDENTRKQLRFGWLLPSVVYIYIYDTIKSPSPCKRTLQNSSSRRELSYLNGDGDRLGWTLLSRVRTTFRSK